MAQFSPQEQTYYNRLFDVVDKEKLGVLPGDASITFLLTSSLPQRTLGEIWALCDPNNTGYLTRDGWWKACRLIGWAQRGEVVREELTMRGGALPKFEGHDLPVTPMAQQTTGNATTGPPLTQADKTQFTRLFVSSNPINGLLPAPSAQAIFLKSGLPTETLAQIWNLADTQQRGALDLPDFVLAMYFIQGVMSGGMKVLPRELPEGLYEVASGGRGRPVVGPTSPVARGTASPGLMGRQMTGQGMVPQRTGQSFSAPPAPQRQFTAPPPAPAPGGWDITPSEKQAADQFYETLDTAHRGFIEGDQAVSFMMQSGLPEGTLAQIWDLADIRKEGKLTRDEFAVAVYLINKKLAGIEPPQTLPASLIPPSLRGEQQGQSQVQRDLFDLFADSPPAVTAGAQGQGQGYFAAPLSAEGTGQGQVGQGQGTRAHLPGGTESFGRTTFGADLMGDDDATPAAAAARAPSRQLSAIQPQATGPKAPPKDYSADLGDAKNSLESTTRAVQGLEVEKAQLEEKEGKAAAELKEIELRLSSVRAQHDNETRIVEDLKRRTREQTETLAKLRSELIANESELSALRAEKDETEQALLRDKEEVRTMGKRMKEVQEETDKLKGLLEKMKKEARQQRGMVAIARKQVQTVEGGRDAVQKEMVEVAAGGVGLDAAVISPQATGVASPGNVNNAASIPLPSTPQRVLSPVATGASRSNNPFDRLGFGGAFAKPPSPVNPGTATGASLFANAFGSQEPVESRDVVETPRDVTAPEQEGLSTLQKATMGAGAAIAAVGVAAGTAAGVAVAGVEKAFGMDGDHGAAPPADTMHEIAQNVKDAASGDHAEPTHVEATPASAVEETHAKASSPEHQDPFGVPDEHRSSDVTPTAETPSARPGPEDPFGMPATASTGGYVTAHEKQSQVDFDDNFESNFDQGFGDDFAKDGVSHDSGDKAQIGSGTFATEGSPADSANGSQDFGQVTSPTADMHLAPATEPKNEFDSALGNADKPVSAIPPQIRGLLNPGMPERTASTQAIASSSSVGTPLSEFAPSTPRSPYTEADSENSPARNMSAREPEQDSDDDEAYGATPARHIEPESSEDEADGPEDLDRSRSPFASQNQQPISAPEEFAPQENPVPALSNLGLGAPLAEDHERSVQETSQGFHLQSESLQNSQPQLEPSQNMQPQFESSQNTQPQFTAFSQTPQFDEPSQQQPQFTEFSQTTQPQSSESFSQTAPQFTETTSQPAFNPVQSEKRRDPPPPPPARSPAQLQSSNPFASFAAVSAPPAATAQQAPSTSSFDDDFDFENLPSAQVSHGQVAPQVETRKPAADFDDEFDDFGNDFEEVRPAAQQPAIAPPVTTTSSGFGAPQLPGFDDNFGLAKPAAPIQPQGKTDKGFGFDDDFESAFTTVPQASQQGAYAPPSGPPPGQSQSARPNLPSRQTNQASKAQPDDLEDVKKLCNMGFDRSLVVEALEANGYDFSKTLNVLLT